MAQLDPIQHQQSKPLKTQTSPTFEQLLQGDSPQYWPSNSSNPVARNQDAEDCWTPQSNKKSVFTKVKEKAKKLKHTLSGKKKNDSGDGANTQPWGINLDEEEEEDDDDPEYLGAPMYESEMAPENYKENARLNPRPNPVVPETHAAPSNAKQEAEGETENPSNKTIAATVTERLAPAYAAVSEVTERLAPAYAAVSEATNTIASKVAKLTITKPENQQQHHIIRPSAPSPSPAESDTEYSAASDLDYSDRSEEFEEKASGNQQNWDKGVSVKEYFMNKLEPGEDEKALSQVISEVISPKKNAGEKGVAEKVRAAVTSILRADEPSKFASTETSKSLNDNSSLASPKLLKQKSVHSTTNHILSNKPMRNRVNASPPIPVSTNAHEAIEEENHGRILQAN